MVEEKELSFWEHLEELRWSLFRVTIVVFLCMVGWFIAMPSIFDNFVLGPTTSQFFLYRWFAQMGTGGPLLPDFGNDQFAVDIININVASQFLTHITTSFWFALIAAFPYLLYEIWKFIQPALFSNEKRSIATAFLFGSIMFYLGCAVGYCVIFPMTFRFLTEYQISQSIVNQISLNSYMGNFMTLVLVMGLVFELPLLAWVLSSMGLITKQFLRLYRRYAIVGLLILAAIITPTGDPFTLMLVFMPLYLLYELAILIVKNELPVDSE
ncbi:MAG: twin-arginine translocase subunit TatC [Phocaeicola sp.]